MRKHTAKPAQVNRRGAGLRSADLGSMDVRGIGFRSARRSKALTALALAASLLLVTACQGDADKKSDGGKKSVTLSISTLGNPFFVDLRDGAQAAAKELGITLNVTDAQNNSATQLDQIANAVTNGAGGIIINAVDSDAAAAAVAPALGRKLPVVAVDRGVTGADLASFISSDSVAGGRQAAEALAKAVGSSGKVIVLQGVPGTTASRDRGRGFTEAISAYPNIQVAAMQSANFDRAEGLNVTTNLLQANPDVVGIFAENDEMALGAIQALGDRAGKSVFVVGFDGTADGLRAVKGGTMTATIAQQPKKLGSEAVKTLHAILNGGTPEKNIPVAVETVNSSNVDKHLQ